MLLSLLASAEGMPGWRYTGSITILTTPEGVDLPAGTTVEDFPLLVRLDKDFFDFGQAKPGGEDMRFSVAGKALAYQIEHWDAARGTASIWVRVPAIQGNARQELELHWGKADAASESDGAAVFNASNGYLGVWHLGDEVRDEVGALQSEDKGTEPVAGMVGKARHFPGKKGVFCGVDIRTLPAGGTSHSTQAWFRSETSNGRIVAWGNEKKQGKVTMNYQSPPQIRMDCYFSNGNVRADIPDRAKGWIHAVHTYEDGQAILYINGEKRGEGSPRHSPLSIERPARMWIGGWYHNFDFIGEIDEVRISSVARSADWVRLEYENQKPRQTLVGPLAQPGDAFEVTPGKARVAEGKRVTFKAQAGGAEKIYWSVVRDGAETIAAVDRFEFEFDAGRITGTTSMIVRFKAVYPDGVKTKDIPVVIEEAVPDPEFTLHAPATWDGRAPIEIVPQITNRAAMESSGAGDVETTWDVASIAVIQNIEPKKLMLTRAQNGGVMTVTATLENGGEPITQSVDIEVTEPESDPWITRGLSDDEMPQDGQFYARDKTGEGTLPCRGKLSNGAEEVFLKIYADGKLVKTVTAKPASDRSYALSAKLKAGLIKYRIEFGTVTDGTETLRHTAQDIVCGDAYLIDGQSNALATDTREESPRVTHDWVRSYARPKFYREGESQNLWCKPVWKAGQEHKAELGWWGMELAKRLVASQKVPIFMINGAAGGTRIDQHQRDEGNPTDLSTIYGRMLWRVREAKLTHGIRAILWHQGENDQGAAGPDGGYGWESYERYFVEMSAAWKRDFPNVERYYIYQIFPNACSMGGGNGDMLREVQRTLPRLYSNMDIISTLGIEPPGGCHYPLAGWAKFADLVQPLIERDFYGKKVTAPLTAPNLKKAYFTSDAKNEIALEFDQAVVWDDALIKEFYLDGVKELVASGSVSGRVVTLKLEKVSVAQKITYLQEMSWSQKRVLRGANGIAALTFCDVPIRSGN